MFGGAGHGGIGHVDIGGVEIGDLGGDHDLGKVMHVLQPVDEAREVVDVDEGRGPVAPPVDFQGRDRIAAGAEMNPPGGMFLVVLGIAAMGHEAAGHGRDHVLHQGPREAQPVVIVDPAAPGQGVFFQDRKGIGHADPFQEVECRLVNAFHVPVGERLVAAARQAGADDVFGWPRPSCPARLAPPGAMCHSVPHWQEIALIGLNDIIPTVVGEVDNNAPWYE